MNMRDKLRWSTKFTPGLALAAAAILLIAGLIVSFNQDRLFHEQKSREISVQASILAASVSAAVTFEDRQTAQEYVNALKINPEIEAVAVFDTRDELFASFSRGSGDSVDEQALREKMNSETRNITVVVPIRQGETILGAVYVRATAEPIARRLTRYAAIMLLAFMAALLLLVLSTAQRELRGANDQLEDRARALAALNSKLQQEMEDRARAEDALRQSQKMEAVGQLSGGIAHDFNNLLAIIRGNLRLLHKRIMQGQTDIQRYIEGADEAVDRAANLTRRLLAFSRRQPLSPSSVNLSELAFDMADMMRHSVGENILIQWHLNATCAVRCDRNQMENVILNLVINARDAMPNGGTIDIATRDMEIDTELAERESIALGRYVELRVSDTGTGMSPETRERALDPFFTTKPQGKGTGLGLSMTFGFVRQSNGQMSIESELGQGTSILIRMPCSEEENGKEATQ